jgi:hypothetical protein
VGRHHEAYLCCAPPWFLDADADTDPKSKHQPRMNTQMFLEDGATGRLIDEGASARIFEYTHYPTHYVVKQQKRQARNSTHPPAFQQKIQQWSYDIVKPPNFTLLRVPAAFEISTSPKATAYVMERIDTSHPNTLQEENQPPQLVKEILLYYFLCSQQGYFPNDYEIYKQPDGYYALVDFDKFGIFITSEKIEFPYHQIIHIRQAEQYSPPALRRATLEDIPDEKNLVPNPATAQPPQPPTSPTIQAMKPRQEKPPKSPSLRHPNPNNAYAFSLDPIPFSL